MLLDTLIANEQNKAALVRLCGDGRLPHAILLEGPRGSGRFTMARAIAAMGVCRHTPPGCGVCVDCALVAKNAHPDVEIYAKSDADGSLTIKSLRTINQSVATPPVQGQRRVVILRDIQDAAQMRTLNTLLKVIEEPPEYLMFVITVDSRENLLATILSRCLLLRMELPPPDVCAAEALRLCPQGDPEKARLLAALCGGNIGRTAAALGDTAGARIMTDALTAAGQALSGESYKLLALLQKYERDRTGARELTACLREIYALALREKFCGGALLPELSMRMTARQGLRLLDAVERCAREGQYNLNLPLALTLLGERLRAAAQD